MECDSSKTKITWILAKMKPNHFDTELEKTDLQLVIKY